MIKFVSQYTSLPIARIGMRLYPMPSAWRPYKNICICFVSKSLQHLELPRFLVLAKSLLSVDMRERFGIVDRHDVIPLHDNEGGS